MKLHCPGAVPALQVSRDVKHRWCCCLLHFKLKKVLFEQSVSVILKAARLHWFTYIACVFTGAISFQVFTNADMDTVIGSG